MTIGKINYSPDYKSEKTHQVTCLDKHVHDLNRACMRGEHWMAFEYPWRAPRERSCACDRVTRPRPVGFVSPQQRPIYRIPLDINGVPCNYGVEFAPEALKNLERGLRC